MCLSFHTSVPSYSHLVIHVAFHVSLHMFFIWYSFKGGIRHPDEGAISFTQFAKATCFPCKSGGVYSSNYPQGQDLQWQPKWEVYFEAASSNRPGHQDQNTNGSSSHLGEFIGERPAEIQADAQGNEHIISRTRCFR